MQQPSFSSSARRWRNITPHTLLQLNAPQRMLLALFGTAAILVSAIIYTTVLMRPDLAAYRNIQHVPVAHFQQALQDLVTHQEDLCKQLKELQVRLQLKSCRMSISRS